VNPSSKNVFEAIILAGGRMVGKTRLQKSMFVLEQAGVGFGFDFSYYHYGPYSEELSFAVKDAVVEGLIEERVDQARWGGVYSVFTAPKIEILPSDDTSRVRRELLAKTVSADSVVLELAATAALLKEEGSADWWGDTAKLKPLKASEQSLAEARQLWADLRKVRTPTPLPALG
jgi:uncharacterized protein YwgA